MAQIIPKLNLNKHPSEVLNGGLIDATNIIVSNDNAVIQTEPQLDSSNINNQLINLIGSRSYTIKYCITCNKELIIFIQFNDDTNNISLYRYNEDYNETKYVTTTDYHGGNLLGTFTYNFDNLIIAFSEYFEDDSKNIPLKTINLGNFKNGSNIQDIKQLENADLHSICPIVSIPKIVTNYEFGAAYKGWYYIFIRYKISNNTYTQWFNTNKSIFVDYFNDDYIFNYYISPDANGKREEDGMYHSFAQSILSDNSEISKITFTCSVTNKDTKYDYYQLGFVQINKSTSKGFKSNDIPINVSTFTFNNTNIEEYAISDLITTYNNYYNSKSLCTIGNRLFIGNYKENNLDKDFINKLKNIKVTLDFTYSQSLAETVNNSTTAVAEYVNDDYGSFSRQCSKYNGDFWYYNAVNAICEQDDNSYNNVVVSHTVYNLTGINDDYYLNIKYKLPNEKFVANSGYTNDMFTEYSETIQAKNIIIAPFVQYFGELGNVYYGKVYIIKDGQLIDCMAGGPLYTQVLFQAIGSGNVRWDKFIVQSTSYSTDTNADPDLNLNASTSISTSWDVINRLSTCGIYPGQPYNFFIHFVNKYGEISRGYNLSNFNVTTNGTSGYNSLGNLIIFCPRANNINKQYKTYTALITIDYTFDDDIVAFFVSYEKLEKSIQYKGYVTQNDDGTVCFYSDELNFADSLNFNFNKIRLMPIDTLNTNDSTGTNINLNYNYSVLDNTVEEASINNTILKVADSFNNILQSTHLELTLSSSVDTVNKIAELYKDDGFNYYNNESKILIPCTDITSNTINVIINTKTAFISKHHAIVYNKVYFNDTLKIFQKQNSNAAEYDVFKHITWFDYAEIPWESLRYNNNPVVTFFPIKGLNTTDENEKTFQLGNIVECKNTIDLYQQVNVAIGDSYPKSLDWYNPNSTYNNNYPKTIRRSNIIQDESHTNAWRQFGLEQYKNITENKGDIVKLIAVGYYFIVHCQHSMFLFNGTDSIEAKENNIQLSSVDFWDTKYKEIVTSDLGYAGIQKEYSGIIGNFGYVFYDSDARRIYRYDNGQVAYIDGDVTNYVRKLKGYNVHIVDDKHRNRLLICFVKDKEQDIVLSYNYNTNTFVSRHTYNYLRGYSTKENTYIIMKYDNDINRTNIDVYKEALYYNAVVNVMLNADYISMKYIEYILYKVAKVTPVALNNYSPVEGLNDLYAADAIRVYSTHCDTGVLDITFKDAIIEVNKVMNYAKPYWRFGNWHFNALRNRLAEYLLKKYGDDECSRIFGNWFVVEFHINSNEQVELETLDAVYNSAENK